MRRSRVLADQPPAGALRSTPAISFVLPLALIAGCTPRAAESDKDAGPPEPALSAREPEPETKPGMIWIPPGVLIAGTPIDRLPRIADEEMPGEQVVMRGFYVDVFPYPNEVGAIPSSNMSRTEAASKCTEQGKRLCTELELERACKGPTNSTYEYGETYMPAPCGAGVDRRLVPNGLNTGCASGFGVQDLHGSVWSWSSSAWARDPNKPNLAALRGGNGIPGELVSRCAHGRGVKPDTRRDEIGVRCCAGAPNTFEVTLAVTRGEPLRWRPPDDVDAPKMLALVPEEVIQAGAEGRPDDRFKFERVWTWHPLGNEELKVGGGCARAGQKERARCGVLIARFRLSVPLSLGWVATDYWQPTVGESETAREIYLYGGDRNGAFRRRVSYAWGRIAVGDKERKRKIKGRDEPVW